MAISQIPIVTNMAHPPDVLPRADGIVSTPLYHVKLFFVYIDTLLMRVIAGCNA